MTPDEAHSDPLKKLMFLGGISTRKKMLPNVTSWCSFAIHRKPQFAHELQIEPGL